MAKTPGAGVRGAVAAVSKKGGRTVTPSGTGSATSAATRMTGGWLSPQAQAALPSVHRAFDINRDPFIAAQLADLDKTEAQRREETGRQEQTGRGSSMVGQDKPRLELNPPPEMRRRVHAGSFNQRWLAEQHKAAMASAKQKERSKTTPQHAPDQAVGKSPRRRPSPTQSP